MKKLLFLLLFTVSIYGQTYQNPTFGTVTTKTNVESATATRINAQETDGKINWLQPVNIPIPIVPTNYMPTATTVGGHLTGIDNKLGTIVATTAGVTTRVWFTADPTTITAGTFYLSNATSKGTAASAIQSVSNDDNQKKYYTQDIIGNAFASATIFPVGVYAGNLSASTTPNSAQQRWTVELYKCDTNGTPIASGITGAPVGHLGVTVITILDSGLLTLADGSVTNVQVSGNLASPLSVAVGERIRYHVSAEKVGTVGNFISQSVYYGTSYNSFLDVPVPLNTTAVQNLSSVTGATTTDALNTLNSRNLQSTYNNSLAPQINTTTALGAVEIRRGSALDTDLVFKTSNGAGSTTASIAGNGGLVATNITDSALTSTFLPKAGTGGLLGNSVISDDGSLVNINLPTTINGNILPNANNARTIGSTSLNYSTLNARNLISNSDISVGTNLAGANTSILAGGGSTKIRVFGATGHTIFQNGGTFTDGGASTDLVQVVGNITASNALINPLHVVNRSQVRVNTTISAIRSLTGTLTGLNFYTTDLGQEGSWYYDSTDTTTADNTGTVLVTADGKRIKRIIGNEIYVDWFGAVGNGVTNDSPAIQAAQTFAETTGKTLVFSGKTYAINSTIVVSQGVIWKGANRQYSSPTYIIRTANVIGISATGVSVLSSGPHIRGLEFRDIRFGSEGRNRSANFMEFKAVSFLRIYNCRFDGHLGRSIYMLEVFDSIIRDCYFGQNGNPTGNIPVVELSSSVSGYEYTNQIHFDNCDFESFYATAVSLTGTNTNAIYFDNCKMESGSVGLIESVFKADSANIISFKQCVISSRGDGSSTVTDMMSLNNCDAVDLDVFFESGVIIGDVGTSPFTRIVTINNTSGSRNYRINANFGNRLRGITGAELIKFTGSYDERYISVYGNIIKGGVADPDISNITTTYLPKGTNTSNLGGIVVSTTPTTSAGTYDILTRNTSTGVVEKVSSASVATIASPSFTGTPTAPTATAGTNTTQIATTAFVQSAVGVQPLRYKALLTQTGTGAPTATILVNTLGATVTYGYSAVGTYTATTSSSILTANKTVSELRLGESTVAVRVLRATHTNSTTITMQTFTSAISLQDGIIDGRAVFEIEVYP